jgi:hypothetical protein
MLILTYRDEGSRWATIHIYRIMTTKKKWGGREEHDERCCVLPPDTPLSVIKTF